MSEEKPQLLPLKQVLQRLNVSKTHFYSLRDNKGGRFSHLPPFPRGIWMSRKLTLYPSAAVDQWVIDAAAAAVAAQIAPIDPAAKPVDDAMRDMVRQGQGQVSDGRSGRP